MPTTGGEGGPSTPPTPSHVAMSPEYKHKKRWTDRITNVRDWDSKPIQQRAILALWKARKNSRSISCILCHRFILLVTSSLCSPQQEERLLSTYVVDMWLVGCLPVKAWGSWELRDWAARNFIYSLALILRQSFFLYVISSSRQWNMPALKSGKA